MGSLTGKKVLMMVAAKNFRDEEYFKTRVVLQGAGAQVFTTSEGVEESTGVLGGKAKIDIDLSKAIISDYQAFILIGGPGVKKYFRAKVLKNLVKEAYQQNKLLGAICLAPSILANAGILKDKKATSFISEKDNLRKNGAIFTGKKVEVDGKIVTASGPEAAEAFGEKLEEILNCA